MLWLYVHVKNALDRFHRSEDGADAFEYLMVVGGVVVAIIIAVVAGTPGLINPVITGVCGAIDTVVPGPAFAC